MTVSEQEIIIQGSKSALLEAMEDPTACFSGEMPSSQKDWRGEWNWVVTVDSASIEHRDAVNFDIHAGAVGCAANACAGNFFPLHERGKGLIEFGEVLGVAQAYPHVDDINECRAGRIQHVLQIAQCLAGLLLDVGGNHFACRRIQRALAGNEQHVAPADRLGERRRDGIVRKARGRPTGRGNDLLRHVFFVLSVI